MIITGLRVVIVIYAWNIVSFETLLLLKIPFVNKSP
jgi:hypothetical protein